MEIEKEEDDNNKKNPEPKKKEIKKEVVQREKKEICEDKVYDKRACTENKKRKSKTCYIF